MADSNRGGRNGSLAKQAAYAAMEVFGFENILSTSAKWEGTLRCAGSDKGRRLLFQYGGS